VNLLSLDLEMNQPSGRIIQIGACVGNIHTGEIVETLSILVDPGEPLSDFIIGLTGITEERLDRDSTSLLEAYQTLQSMHKRHTCFMNPLTWGGGDSYELKKQLIEQDSLQGPWCFGRRWIDVKTLYHTRQLMNGKPVQAGLAKALVKLGLQFKGRKHDALDDAINTFKIFLELGKPYNVSS
jgi:inhibitor of KinA sporulation pathway (predicted exonuclease)